MVQLYTCENCKRGDCKHCLNNEPKPKSKKLMFGGRRCICNHTTIEKMSKLIQKNLKKLIEHDQKQEKKNKKK